MTAARATTKLLRPMLAVVLSATSAGAARGEPARAQRLELGSTPAFVLLGEGGRATVRIPTEGETPVVATSVGRLDALRAGSGGVYEAELVPPPGADPLLAIVAAATPSGFGWLAVPLHGTRELELRGAPNALVAVTVDGREFGPVQADAKGRATLRVDVPPGTRHAIVAGRRVELDVPRPGAASVVSLDRAELDANVAATVTIRTVALSDRAQPIAGPPPTLEVSEGVVSRPVERGPGVHEAIWQLQPGRIGTARVTARFAKAPRAAAILPRVPGAPRAAELTVDHARVVAGDVEELRVTGRVVDAAGNPIDVPARLVVSIGAGASARFVPEAVVSWVPADGGYVGRVRVPPRSGRHELELRVIAAGGIEASRTIAVVPGAPTGVVVQPEGELLADGRPRALRVSFVDRHGNAADAPAATPVLVAARGTTGPAALREPGVYEVEYRSPLAASDFHDLVTARAGTIDGRAELAVRARGSTFVVSPRAGYRVGSGGLSSAVTGAEAALWTEPLHASFGIVVGLDRFAFSRDEELRAGALPLRLRSEGTFWGVDVGLAWRRPVWRGLAWLGAGGGAVHGSTRVSLSGQGDLWGDAWAPQLHASAAWGPRVGRGFPFAEVRLGWQGDPRAGPLRGSIQTLTLLAGYRLDVF